MEILKFNFHSKARALIAASTLTLANLTAGGAAADSSAETIKNCPDGDWCSYHRTVDKAWRHSPLTEITKDNVKDLKVAWMFLPGDNRMGLQSTPLVVDGKMYVSTNPSNVWSVDAASGERLWSYEPDMDQGVVARSFFAHSRGIAIGDGRIYLGRADGYLDAINTDTGELMWSKQLVDSSVDTAGFAGAGTFVNSDLFVIGQTGGEYPVEGRIFGVDPKTGDLKWTFFTTGRDDPEALATWGGDSWKWGGGGAWQPGTVDYDNNQIFMGTSNPNPDYDFCGEDCLDPNAAGHRPGSNLYTSSTLALDLDTGELNWYFQEVPSDAYDYDAACCEFVKIEGEDGNDVVLHPGKGGFYHIFDTKTGEPEAIYANANSINWTSGYNMETKEWENRLWPKGGEKTLVCPAIDGAHSFNAGTYDPSSNTFFRVAQEWCMNLTINEEGGTGALAGSDERVVDPFAVVFMAAAWEGANPPGDEMHGRITARDPLTGDIKWEKRYDVIPHSALMSTASGLLFNATYEGDIEALDSETGDQLWDFNLGTATNGGIVSYEVDGKQYVAVTTGHGTHTGNAVVANWGNDALGNLKNTAAVVAFELPN